MRDAFFAQRDHRLAALGLKHVDARRQRDGGLGSPWQHRSVVARGCASVLAAALPRHSDRLLHQRGLRGDVDEHGCDAVVRAIDAEHTAWQALGAQWNALATAKLEAEPSWLQRQRETVLVDRLRAQRPDFDEMSNAALVAYARSLAPYERMTWRGELVAGAQAAIGPAVIGSVLPPDSGISPFDLVGPAGDVVSAAPSYALWDLSRIVRNDAALTALFDAGIVGIVPVLKDKHPDFHQKLQVFLREFGYRGPSEWDLGADSWETRPELPLGLVDRMRQLGDDQSPASRRGEATAAAEALVARIVDGLAGNDEALGTLRMGLDSARRFAGWRELGKSNCIKIINEARVALLEMGRRLTSEGHFTHPRQIFMALDGELDRLVLQPDLVTAAIAQREADWKEYADLDVP